MLRSIAMLLALLSALSAARAQAPPNLQTSNEPVTHFGLTFPPEIGGAKRISVRAYEPTSRGGGYSAGYRHGEATGSVFIYDDRVRSIPDNLKSVVVRQHFKRAKAVIGSAPKDVISVKERNAFTIDDSKNRQRFLCAGYTLVKEGGGGAFDTFLCLGVYKGKFLKVRTTMPHREDADTEVGRFVGLWVTQLWDPPAAR